MPRGYFRSLPLQPGTRSPRNNRFPNVGGVFKSPDTHDVRMPPDSLSEMTKEGPTVTVKEETTTPGASYGGDEQEAAGH
ncbi:hypothetical protein NDU88_007415 [Pleurodeles waltl]|uniref:Uncharacterized protein n=1 Tax=Pleurodeles waltl TaxID=8319 RepID=A0AAV7QPS1_PLEWA|nr:hypothetical protein NDU88_007415 [Pleurodeles waltl]